MSHVSFLQMIHILLDILAAIFLSADLFSVIQLRVLLHLRPATVSPSSTWWNQMSLLVDSFDWVLPPCRFCSLGGGRRRMRSRSLLLGSSCSVISGEQMEESPHLAGDRFCPRSSRTTFSLFVSSLNNSGEMSPPKPVRRWRRRTQESLEREHIFRDFLWDPEGSVVQLLADFSYLSLLCLQPSVYTCPPHPHAASRDPSASCWQPHWQMWLHDGTCFPFRGTWGEI